MAINHFTKRIETKASVSISKRDSKGCLAFYDMQIHNPTCHCYKQQIAIC